jgi:hypothetical protein
MKSRRIRYKIVGYINECPKCNKLMERREHNERPRKIWFYEKWDYCKDCGHLQHYEEFKSDDWKELDQQNLFFKNI